LLTVNAQSFRRLKTVATTLITPDHDRLTATLAELVVREGVRVSLDQDVLIVAYVEQVQFARALTEAAYAAGARYVDVWYWDQHTKRSRIRHAPADSLSWVPPWLEARAAFLTEQRGALIQVNANPEPNLLIGLDLDRIAADRMPTVDRLQQSKTDDLISWSIVAYPTAGWAEAIFGEPDIDRLWQAFAEAMRLNEPDPNLAWRQHLDNLAARAAQLTAQRFASLRLSGGGTDLTVGLIPSARWMTGEFETTWGHRYVANLPTEEVFTTPDWRRAAGIVRATRPLARSGALVEDLELRFEDGRIVEVQAAGGADLVRAEVATDDGAASLGEIALVDDSSPIGRSGLTFVDTLFDENASSHLAYGSGIVKAVPGAAELEHHERPALGLNVSRVHTDVVIGGPHLRIEGVTEAGDHVPILVGGQWQLTD
jgi:aminopeptidase